MDKRYSYLFPLPLLFLIVGVFCVLVADTFAAQPAAATASLLFML